MQCHEYLEVTTKTETESSGKFDELPAKYFLRQVFVSSAIWTPFFAIGLCLGTPTVFVPQVRREANSTAAVSVEMVSWLASAYAYASIPWCFFLAYLMSYIGRKRTFIIVALNQVVVATAYYLSVTPVHLLITEVLQGLTHAGGLTVTIVAIVEYTSPENRGLLLTIKSATMFWGIWAANAIGTYTHWKYIAILQFLNAFYSLTSLVWPESPVWLAKQGRYEECRKSHRWLKGYNERSETELDLMIDDCMEDSKIRKQRTIRNTFAFFLEKQFYYPMFLSALMMVIYHLSGKQVVTLYAIDIIKQITSSEATAYRTMLILDGVSVIAMYIGCFLSKICKRRFLLFTFGSLTVLFLLALSLYLYLVHLLYLSENKYVSVALLIGFSISISLGPIILATSLFGELIPLEYKSQATVIVACTFVLIQSVLLKNTPYIMKYFDLHGMFLFYGVSVCVCLIVLFRYLPETKDKTLQEIESYFKN